MMHRKKTGCIFEKVKKKFPSLFPLYLMFDQDIKLGFTLLCLAQTCQLVDESEQNREKKNKCKQEVDERRAHRIEDSNSS